MHKASIIVIGGEAPHKNIISWNVDTVIVADAGFRVCKKWKLRPHVVIGDFDSVDKTTVEHEAPKASIVEFQRDKDKSDTQLALEHAHALHSDDITIIGGIGKRIDHFLSLLELCKSTCPPTRMVGPRYQFEMITDKATIQGHLIQDKLISFFPVTSISTQTSKGLRWELDEVAFQHGTHSLSNEIEGEVVNIEMTQGSILAVWKHGDMVQRTQEYQ